MVEARDVVEFTDAGGAVRLALIVRVHETNKDILNAYPSVNLLTLAATDKEDPHGIQAERYDNVPNVNSTSAPGFYWKEWGR